MKSLSPQLQGHLDDGTTTLSWCWRITRLDGVVYGFTDHDRALAFGDTVCEPEAGLTASEIRSGSDLSVDSQDAEGVLRSDRINETDILDGLWDNADVEVWRVNWADTAQRVLLRRGSIGEIRRGRVSFVAEVRSMAHILGQTLGRTYQSGCDAAVGDARCGVNIEAAAYRGSGLVVARSGDRGFTASGLASFPSGWFARGTIQWTEGTNVGRIAEVAAHDLAGGVATVQLLEPPVRSVAATDAFVIRAGCNKRIETCASKFSNVANFRGFPNIPGQDAVIRFATKSGGHSGGVL